MVEKKQHSSDLMEKKILIEKRLEQSHMKEKLEAQLKQKLIECGWKDALKQHCLELIKSKGLEKINLDELVEELLPKGRALVPTSVKEDLLGQIKTFLENDPEYKKVSGL